VPLKTCWRCVIHQWRPAGIAIIAATTVWNYFHLLHGPFLNPLTRWTTQAVHAVLQLFDPTISVSKLPQPNSYYTIASSSYAIHFAPHCSGIEGIFLFQFLLSGLTLTHWDSFSKRAVVPLYFMAAVYSFLVNVIRISALYAVGYWAYRPDAWSWVKLFQ